LFSSLRIVFLAVTVFWLSGHLSIKPGMVPDKTNTQVKQNRHKSDSGETNYLPSSHHTDLKLFALANFTVLCLSASVLEAVVSLPCSETHAVVP
jgi:hypothetical protein